MASMMDKMKKIMAEPLDDDADEGEWDEDYDLEDAEDYDYDTRVAAVPQVPGALMRPRRIMSNAANRQCNVGIHTIELYAPQFYFDQVTMEEYDAGPDRYGPAVIGKYTKGIGQVEGRLNTDDEDPVSMALTVTHRIVERIERVGFNQTSNYSDDGKSLPLWNAFGRLDIGSESLIDRSKSMKTFVMDLFERYGDGEADIEGVDMYNACYGGQAAGLCVLNWVESDRWDGRYGLSIATDISDVHNTALFVVGAACTATLFYPDAPLAHCSLRASCILHRYDFFKPVGWHSMAPLSDGKYSVNAYMDCVDMCHQTLKKKMNGTSIVQSCRYNVFHTGGGFHIIKKAYERLMRSDDPSSKPAARAAMLQAKLIPSTFITKIVGPCHTVSSFLNISSTIMNAWDKALGGTLVVFTYGSGSAASMYQTLFNDIPWMKPFGQWKLDFYREALYRHPKQCGKLQDLYCDTWMKFGYYPHGRQLYGEDPWQLEQDVYYLMEIDSYGRRFYHRGGIAAPPMDKKWVLKVDADEGRRVRADWGPLPAKPEEKAVMDAKPKEQKTLNEVWADIEAQMLAEYEPPSKAVTQEQYDKINPQHKIIVETVSDNINMEMVKHDGSRHTYQIVGTWSGLKEAEEMQAASDSTFVFDITVGENGWEEFYLLQDGDWERKICPATARSWKAMPSVGPYNFEDGKRWLIDTRDSADTPLEDMGSPGDKYRVTFTWVNKGVKELEWLKLDGRTGPYPKGTYQISGSWSSDYIELKSEGAGKYSAEVKIMSNDTAEFYVVRNSDEQQRIYPDVAVYNGSAKTKGSSGDMVMGVGSWPSDKAAPVWEMKASIGDAMKISFYRNPENPDEMELEWDAK
jgi:3-hydroxy-3-methylglutaryl CoA synthase